MSIEFIDFAAIEGQARIWTFEGEVADGYPVQGLVVRFHGIPSVTGKTAIVDENGKFSLTVELAVGEDGTVTASVTSIIGVTAEMWDIVRQTKEEEENEEPGEPEEPEENGE